MGRDAPASRGSPEVSRAAADRGRAPAQRPERKRRPRVRPPHDGMTVSSSARSASTIPYGPDWLGFCSFLLSVSSSSAMNQAAAPNAAALPAMTPNFSQPPAVAHQPQYFLFSFFSASVSLSSPAFVEQSYLCGGALPPPAGAVSWRPRSANETRLFLPAPSVTISSVRNRPSAVCTAIEYDPAGSDANLYSPCSVEAVLSKISPFERSAARTTAPLTGLKAESAPPAAGMTTAPSSTATVDVSGTAATSGGVRSALIRVAATRPRRAARERIRHLTGVNQSPAARDGSGPAG